uniref:chloroplast enveloppe membrane protein n=1 Tax=Streptosarcina costaricana TaxID=2058783 RepID=UPI00286A89F0|nr:chloroplast enveloppe membrane protein [Streptosarcina costaricana]WKT08924.1 chloroplast enveloppe membrane protein [Streptosarcina costaricana]
MRHMLARILQWIKDTPFRALEKAYNASERAQAIQEACVRYKRAPYFTPHRSQSLAFFLDAAQDRCINSVYWSLLEFQVSQGVFRLWSGVDGSLAKLPVSTFGQLAFIEKVIGQMVHDRGFAQGSVFKDERHVPSSDAATAYEPIGLIPRSITRTFSRFQTELDPQAESILRPEFQLIRYQVKASVQYLASLLVVPWGLTQLCKQLFLESYIAHWWNTGQRELFLNPLQEERALSRLQGLEDTAWLELLMDRNSDLPLSTLSHTIHEHTLELVSLYNEQSMQTLLHVCMDGLYMCTLAVLLVVGQARFALVKSLMQELFYSLSDTMKAFLILLFTDLFIGFHSPHGWEILIESLLRYLGFAHNQYVVSLFVSTFPVILDTVFKYWIFRHLNRTSPSIVVTYHTMNE